MFEPHSQEFKLFRKWMKIQLKNLYSLKIEKRIRQPHPIALKDSSKRESMKYFVFSKGLHQYSFHYDDVKELINHLVDVADGDNTNLDLMDIFNLVRQLAKRAGQVPEIEKSGLKSD